MNSEMPSRRKVIHSWPQGATGDECHQTADGVYWVPAGGRDTSETTDAERGRVVDGFMWTVVRRRR